MGQKIHPIGFRLGINKFSKSTWFSQSKNYSALILEDFIIRNFIKTKLKQAAVSSIIIERKSQQILVKLLSGRPGVVVGRGGQGLDSLRKSIQTLTSRKDVQVNVVEVTKVDADSQIIAESIAQQLEKRVAYRRAVKMAIQRAMKCPEVKGIKIQVSGRLNGAEIARSERAKEGQVPLHTLKMDIDYGTSVALTMFGNIGIKVWVNKGLSIEGKSVVTPLKRQGNNRLKSRARSSNFE